jgi:sugar phosphate isomerase/epimerase
MSLFREKLYISTTAEDAPALAGEYGLGLEIADFCTAMNMDVLFREKDAAVREKMRAADRFVFHAPFSELCPAAIDPLVREVTRRRYRQAISLAEDYGIKKLVIHSGFIPHVYFPEWYIPESVGFWKDFLSELPEGMTVCLENVMESGPELLRDIVSGVNDPRLRACLDTGHAFSHTPDPELTGWIDTLAPYLGHVHIHNNDGAADRHRPLGEGGIDMRSVLDRILSLVPEATFTVENMLAAPSIDWLRTNDYI